MTVNRENSRSHRPREKAASLAHGASRCASRCTPSLTVSAVLTCATAAAIFASSRASADTVPGRGIDGIGVLGGGLAFMRRCCCCNAARIGACLAWRASSAAATCACAHRNTHIHARREKERENEHGWQIRWRGAVGRNESQPGALQHPSLCGSQQSRTGNAVVMQRRRCGGARTQGAQGANETTVLSDVRVK